MSDPNTSSNDGEPDSTIAPGDVLGRLQAAGFDDDEAYEDIEELGNNGEAPPEGTEPLEELLPGKDEEEQPLDPELDEEGKPKQAPDALGLQGKGTREAPLRHKDLPADKFVEVKTADGQKVVVNLKDALAGTFMSRDKVDREVSVAKEAQQQAQRIAERAIEHQRQANAGVQAMIRNPEALVKALVEHNMPVLHQVAKAYALMRKDPSLREGLLSAIREERVNAQGQEVERKRKQLEQQEQETAQQAHLERTLKPAYRQGLREAGILRDADITDELRDGIRMRFQFVQAKHGRTPTPDEMRLCVVHAAQELKAKGKLKALPKPRAAPTPPPAELQPNQRPANGKVDWTKVPHEQRMKDPRFLFDRAARRSVQ